MTDPPPAPVITSAAPNLVADASLDPATTFHETILLGKLLALHDLWQAGHITTVLYNGKSGPIRRQLQAAKTARLTQEGDTT